MGARACQGLGGWGDTRRSGVREAGWGRWDDGGAPQTDSWVLRLSSRVLDVGEHGVGVQH